MKRQTLMRLCFAMLMLATTVGLAAVSEQGVDAAPCCSTCDGLYYGCLGGSSYPECACDPWCCDQSTEWCYRHCSFSC
ncbi:MAG TPA: hypothetical protein VGX68_17360 [Thermoanaerobaculia bacterium]|jgi:hypothetical protein|nr:hypothetical protein [Thermoanaerobaculia bacterium]